MVIALAREAVLARDEPEDEEPFGFAPEPHTTSTGPRAKELPGSEELAGIVERKLLIVEDDDALRATLAEILRMEGYDVVEAEDGEIALARLNREPVEILVLDLHMPRLDGVDLLRRISAPPPVVLVHSAFEYYKPEDLRAEVGPKVFRYLRKPVAPLQLMSALREAVSELEKTEGDSPR
jgi:CheY-like chemotaxis protein